MAFNNVLKFSKRAAESSSLPWTTSLTALATCANTGLVVPACSNGAMSFLSRKSPPASGLPAMARRRTSLADSSIKAILMVGCALISVSEPDDVALGHNAQGLGTKFLRIEVVVEADQHDLTVTNFFWNHLQQRERRRIAGVPVIGEHE